MSKFLEIGVELKKAGLEMRIIR